MDKINELKLPETGRVIVISDIHGEIGLFKELLNKAGFSGEDYLIINGDLCEKGGNSKEVVRYVMELAATNPNVHVIEGNCDALVEHLLKENPQLLNYLAAREHTLIGEWLKEVGFQLNDHSTIQEVKEVLLRYYGKEMEWLANLPTAIETDRYIFVHAGLEDGEDWKETERSNALAMPSFLEKSHRTGKFVVVGHWPVVNYSTDIPSDNPIIDEAKKIIAIDGGNVIKPTGQLNAFIIQRTAEGDSFSHLYVDKLPSRAVTKDFVADSAIKGSINYPFYTIVPVERGEFFTLCRQPETGRMFYVKNEYILQNENGDFTIKTDVSCAQISVTKGETVSVIDEDCSGYALIKKEGKAGWIPGECLMD
ncbi:serine/threonine protein phosphatase [Neobacillus piezotolerans]|uniref:Serine/threonine protein phosphatase n=1 Tax=Neobacillus piezotolerans TaxID=2259171 RepID=A0A3D8GU27_9BACI|nr:metallophosphoesterase [Neobacillus piezotolerans]RDU37897.1 serine/threonine protein phosphatase [Neobacillus piezotolerans]